MIDGFRDLTRITEAAFQADLAWMQRLANEESGLRETLDDLDRQLRDSLGNAIGGETPWHAVGADEAWRKWLMRRRGEVNMQLARVMAAKAEAMTTLRRSLARSQVSGEILEMKLGEQRAQQNRLY